MTLTKTLCQRLEPREKPYKKFDGGGLYLEIMPSGKKFWRLKYRYLGKEKRFSFGEYPIITLSVAREKRLQAKKLLDQGIDPSKAKQEALIRTKKEAENCYMEPLVLPCSITSLDFILQYPAYLHPSLLPF